MSHASSSSRAEPDIWEFVTCSKCHLPFSLDPAAPPQVPFWLTECGHVICNLHLNADQSCCECGAQRIQMIPLQRELDPPMSYWFSSVPQAMDTISYSLKACFQQDMLMSLIRFLREKLAQQRDVLLRVKHEREELKSLRKTVEQLRAENEQLRLYAGLEGSGSHNTVGSNAKRRRVDAYNDGRNPSSPRSAMTPLGPNRLTLPVNHQPPTFGQRSSNTTIAASNDSLQRERPASSRLQCVLDAVTRATLITIIAPCTGNTHITLQIRRAGNQALPTLVRVPRTTHMYAQ
ncbi:hypothetical protein BC834DRAFT_816923 [Gloeopeniophorella convolvens]|nr:hypothetical protein BC834DRAFT_816923 [Gloeopeniophorella convolvens]